MGPMFSGKTSKLLEIYRQCTFCNMRVTVINHSDDTRYQGNAKEQEGNAKECKAALYTHDQTHIPCVYARTLMSVSCADSDVVLINEGQFFPDLFEFVVACLAEHKRVHVAGLDGDFERRRFGQVLDLVPMCDKVTKLASLCGRCKDGTPGIFSKRLTEEKGQTLIGSANYMPVCRRCYA